MKLRCCLYLYLLVILTLLIASCSPDTPQYKDKNGKVIQNSIASLEKVRLGGIDQWILVRGKDKSNPILLILHGGPGTALIGIKISNEPLEEHFTVVNWDQRGAGGITRNIRKMKLMK